MTPRRGEPPLVQLRFEPLACAGSWRGEPTEKYGAASEFARIDKREDPASCSTSPMRWPGSRFRPRLASWISGVNTGEPLALVMQLMPASQLASAIFVGIDHSTSALAVARGRFGDQVQLIEGNRE